MSDRDWDDAHLINTAYDVHYDDPAFGYRFVTDELHREGVNASERRVWPRTGMGERKLSFATI